MSDFEKCILDEVDRAFCNSLPDLPPKFAGGAIRPREVLNAWYKDEDQNQIGSCNGCAWAGLGERVGYSSRKDATQLSKLWTYLMAQKVGGLLGSDTGSRPSDGGKIAFAVGFCPEILVPYDGTHYPRPTEIQRILSEPNKAAALPHKVEALWKKPQSHAETLDVIGLSGGGWVYGIQWYQGLIPKDRVVKTFDPRGKRILGGHAMNALGYRANEDLEAHNSHNDPPFWITPKAWEQMLAHPYTSVVGATGTTDAHPIDWMKNSLWRNK